MENLRAKKGFICDMDGVIYHGNQLLPGVKEFVEWLQKEEKQFLFPRLHRQKDPSDAASASVPAEYTAWAIQ